MQPLFANPKAGNYAYAPPATGSDTTHLVLGFHRTLPGYAATPLRPLPELARELGVGRVLVKDESLRFGLPSFKILGASWAVYRAVLAAVGGALPAAGAGALPSLEEVGARAREEGVRLVTCTEGNWGRAVGRMARYLGIPAKIFVPADMVEETRGRIRAEGAEVVAVEGGYAEAVVPAKREAEEGALLVLDFGWEGFEEIPQWVIEGYSTMLAETTAQLATEVGQPATHAIVPLGMGSIAQAVTQHYKSVPGTTVIAVEPTSAAGLRASLEAGEVREVATGHSIMCGLNCGTVAASAWPVLARGVDLSAVVSEREAHGAVLDLAGWGVGAGPCGAATVVALRRAAEAGLVGRESVVVLFCTEGTREYAVPE